MMALLVRSDGKEVSIPDANVEKALATGQFSLPPQQQESTPFIDHSGNAPLPKKPVPEASNTVGVAGGSLSQQDEQQPAAGSAENPIKLEEETNQTKFIDNSAMNESIPKNQGLPPEIASGNKKVRDIEGPRLTVINKDTQQPEEVPEDDANKLVAQGTHTISDVPLIRADGKIVSIPDENIQKALLSGQFRLSTKAERLQDQTDKQNAAQFEEHGATGLKPYVGSDIDAALAGINQHNPVNQIGSSLFGNPDVVAKVEENASRASESNPVSYYSGAGIGEVASAVGLGGVAGKVSSGLGLGGAGASLASRAAKIATEGAIFSAEPVIKNIINKDPAGAAEALALGVGLNFGIHGVFSAAESIPGLVNKTTNAIAEKVAPSEVSQEEAENVIGKQVLGLTPAKIANLREQIGPALRAAGITSEDVASGKALEKIQALEESGPRIGAAIKELDELLASEKAPIIDEHLREAKANIEKLMPKEVQDQNALAAKINELLRLTAEDSNEAKVLQEYIERTEKYSQHINEAPPLKPDELIDWEKAQNPTERPTVKPGKKIEVPEGERPTTPPPEGYEPKSITGERPNSEAVKEYDAAKADYDKRHAYPASAPMITPHMERVWNAAIAAEPELEKSVEELNNIKLPPSALQAQKALQPMLDEIDATIKKGTFEDTQALKKFIREQTNFTDNGYINNLRKSAYHLVSEHLMGAEDAAAQTLGANPVLAQGLREQRAAYTFHKLFGDAADRLAAKQVPEEALQKLLGSHQHNRSIPIMLLHMLGVPSPIAVAAGFASPFAKQYLAKQGLKRAAAKLLGEAAEPETNTILHAIQLQNIKIKDSVKETLSALISGGIAKAPSFHNETSINEFIPESSINQSHQNKLNTLRSAVSQNIVNPEQLANHLGQITAGLRKEGLDQVAEAYTEHQIRMMKVIQTVLPLDKTMSKAHPFSAKVDISEIDAQTKAKYNRALTIASDPIKLLELIKSNSITPMDVAIAAAVNPSTLQKLRDELVNEAMKSKPNLSYQQRLSMDIIMGTNLDESTEQLPVLQGVYAAPGPTASTGKKNPKPKTMDSKAQDRFNQSYLTTAQKAQGHI